jgi:hypothetical protein
LTFHALGKNIANFVQTLLLSIKNSEKCATENVFLFCVIKGSNKMCNIMNLTSHVLLATICQFSQKMSWGGGKIDGLETKK